MEMLTEKEKWECTAKWLNALYIAFCKNEEVEIPCAACPYHMEKCGENVPPPANFKVMEKHTGDGTIVSCLFD